jgi:hypothetical protein
LEAVPKPLAATRDVFPSTVTTISIPSQSFSRPAVLRGLFLSSTFHADLSLCEGTAIRQQNGAGSLSRKVEISDDVFDIYAKRPLPTRIAPSKPLPSETEAVSPTLTASPTSSEEVEKPKRIRHDVRKRSVGSNPYGRKGTLRCSLCRRWRRKASLITTNYNCSVYMMRKILKSPVSAAVNAEKNALKCGVPRSSSRQLDPAPRLLRSRLHFHCSGYNHQRIND